LRLHKFWLVQAVSLVMSCLVFVPQASANSVQLVNGGFYSSGGGWEGARFEGVGNDACLDGMPNIGTWEPNTLAFSYVQSTVTQQILVPEPTKITLRFTIKNRGDQPGATFSAEFGSTSTGVITPSTTATQIELTYTTSTNNEPVSVSFSGKDETYWAGCYGTYVTNASFFIETHSSSGSPIFYSNALLSETHPDLKSQGQTYTCNAGIHQLFWAGTLKEVVNVDVINYYLIHQNQVVAVASSEDFRSISINYLELIEAGAIVGSANLNSAQWQLPNTLQIEAGKLSCRTVSLKGSAVAISSSK
jgi:hypothetical protein